jgi:hypothetical protein
MAAAAAPASAQGFPQPRGFATEDPVLRRIWSLGMDSSWSERLGQVLLDSLGPRLTGTPGIEAAQRWVVNTYQAWGLTARQEQYGTWRGWRRGRTHLDLVQPRVRSLEATMLAWSPGTPNGRTVRGEVVLLPDVPDTTAFTAWLRTARGKFVATSFAQPSCRPDTNWASWATRETYDRMRAARTAAQQAWTQRVQRLVPPAPGGPAGGGAAAGRLQARLEAAGVAGILQSNWSQGWGVNKVFGASTRTTPVVDVSCEDYGLVFRLAQNNQGPVIELTADAQALGEVPVFNVIAEILGRELPSEYVMLSAHFDSWDGSSGATDNGTGTITMMEAMRILRLAYPSPRRTILVGHWSGEEQGLNGSRAFAADHPPIVEGLQALFNQDNGTGRVSNMSSAGLVDATASLARWLARVPADITRHITFSFPGGPAGGGSDNASFICSGAPGFSLGSNSWDYGVYTWHTNRDTYDKISWDDVRNNATLTAMLAYLASEDPERVPRTRRTVFATGPQGQSGGWPQCQQPQRAAPALPTP